MLYLQEALGYTPLLGGLALLPFAGAGIHLGGRRPAGQAIRPAPRDPGDVELVPAP